MFDFIKRWIWGDLEKDKVRAWATDKIKKEEEEAIFQKKCNETPSFSKCVITNRIEKRSQKQNHQLKSYKQATKKSVDV